MCQKLYIANYHKKQLTGNNDDGTKNGIEIRAFQTDENDSDISYSINESHDNSSDSGDSSIEASRGGTDMSKDFNHSSTSDTRP